MKKNKLNQQTFFDVFKNGKITKCTICALLTYNGEAKKYITSAITRLQDGDTFQQNLSNHIAESKAARKLYKNVILYFNKKIEDLEKQIKECKEMRDKYTHSLNIEEEHFNQLIK